MKRLLSILLSLCCLFLVGCESAASAGSENQSESSSQIEENPYEEFCNDKFEILDVKAWKESETLEQIQITFTAKCTIDDLIIEFPIYSYEIKDSARYNLIKRATGTHQIGGVVKNEKYIITHPFYRHQSEQNIQFSSELYFTIGEINIKSGTIIEE